MTYQWDKEVDIIVVGSGAGGMVSALAAVQNQADVMIIEKAKLWGGSSATSGGGIWVPAAMLAKAAGFDDDLTVPIAIFADNLLIMYQTKISAPLLIMLRLFCAG